MKNCNMQPSMMPECNMRDTRIESRMDTCIDGSKDAHRMSESRMGEMCYMREPDMYRCEQYPSGMAYVPWQSFKDIYDPERGLEAGTIFAELEKPFWGRRAFKR